MNDITLDAIGERLAPLVAAFTDEKRALYLVGGVVRDLRLGRSVGGDLDFTTDALPDDIQRLVAPLADAVWLQGVRFGTVGARVAGLDLEITTHRAEAYTSESRKPVVRFASDVQADLSRRDFTVNAMAIDVVSGALVDPFDGATDLDRGVLRTPLDAETSFSDDPLRMLRAARFVASHGFEPVPDLVSTAAAMADRLTIVSSERIRDELTKLVCASDPAAGLTLLTAIGLYELVLTEVDHASLTLADVARVRGEPVMRLAALFRSAPVGDVLAAMRRLRFSSSEQRAVGVAVSALQSMAAPPKGDAEIRRLHLDLGDHLDMVMALGAALATDDLAAWVAGHKRLTEAGDFEPPIVALSGDDIMALLDIGPGKSVGDARSVLVEHFVTHGRLDRGGSSSVLEAWWSDRPASD